MRGGRCRVCRVEVERFGGSPRWCDSCLRDRCVVPGCTLDSGTIVRGRGYCDRHLRRGLRDELFAGACEQAAEEMDEAARTRAEQGTLFVSLQEGDDATG